MNTRRLAQIALLSALSVALRYAFGAFPNIKPITAIFLVLSITLVLADSLMVMALTMVVTSFIFGFGPWVLWQLLAYGVVLFLWKMLCYPLTKSLKSATIRGVAQSVLAGLMGILYGLVIDSVSALFYQMPIWAYLLNGISFNLAHAISTALFYPIIVTIFARLEQLTH
ncbi:ECF transporter S component [Streptococcus entericus]|uniref:hypothetical protein n=1 Tax=Streptococcus entericus TaxID=155680 RepID=UPI00035FD0AC|nr:hypothetical protein [Streptococcus entericus]